MLNNRERPVALITGATGGLGYKLALAFNAAGYAVAVHYHRNEKIASRLVQHIEKLGGQAYAFNADVGSSADVKRMFSAVQKHYGRLDVLVHSAGNIEVSLLVRMSSKKFDDVLRVHLKGAFLCTQAAARLMKKRGHGVIVYVGSILGLKGAAGECNYAAAKAGLIGLAKSAARELGAYGICVNVVLPGYMLTAMGLKTPTAIRQAAKRDNVLGRWTDANDSARSIVGLCGLPGISGQVFNWDARIV